MSKRDVAGLALKILGLYTFIQGVGYFMYIFSSDAKGSDLLVLAIGPMTFVVIGLLVLLFAEPMAGVITKDSGVGEGQVTSIAAADIQRIAFSVVGLFLLTTVIPVAFRTAGQLLNSGLLLSDIGSFAGLVELALKLAIGLWLFFGGRSLVAISNRSQQVEQH